MRATRFFDSTSRRRMGGIRRIILLQIVYMITLTQTSDLAGTRTPAVAGSAPGDVTTTAIVADRSPKHNINLNITSTKIIDLSKLNLTTIHLSDKLIRNSKSDIEVINLSHNLINETFNNNFFKFPNLKHLDLANNLIEAIAIESHHLIYLNLSNNLLNNVTLKSCESLQILDLSCNQLGGHGTALVAQDDRNDSISSPIHLGGLKSLVHIDLSCNHIQRLDREHFADLRNVTILNLSFNYLRKIQNNLFDYLVNLEILNLSNNNISDIELYGFSNLENLQYLDLSNNQIHVASVRSLQGIPDLIGLSVAHNYDLRDSLQGFVASWSLNELDISGTGLCEIPSALAQSVKLLKITDNNLEIIRCGDLDSYPLLHELILSFNALATVEDDAIGRLELLKVLYLDHNKLINLPISLPSNLLKLYLNSNRLTEINARQMQQLYNLELLDLSDNHLNYVSALPLPKLQILNLRSTNLLSLSQALVKSSPILRDLYLENNPIKCADLLGIAEWATPCREEKYFTDEDESEDEDSGDEESSVLTIDKKNNYYHQFLTQNVMVKCRAHQQWLDRHAQQTASARTKCTNNIIKLSNAIRTNESERNNTRAKSNLTALFNQRPSATILPAVETTTIIAQQKREYPTLPKIPLSDALDAPNTTLSSRVTQPASALESSRKMEVTTESLSISTKAPTPSTTTVPKTTMRQDSVKSLNMNQKKYLTQNTTAKIYHKKKASASSDRKNSIKSLKVKKDLEENMLKDEVFAVSVKDEHSRTTSTASPSRTPAKRTEKSTMKEIANISIKSFSTHRTSSLTPASKGETVAAVGKGRVPANATTHNAPAPKKVTHINHNNFETKLNMMNEKEFMLMNSINSNDIGHSSTPGGSGNKNDNGNSTGGGNLVKYEKLNDLRLEQKHINHPGLFMVIGATIGIVITLGLIHLYRCRKPYANQHPDCNTLTATPSHSDVFRLDVPLSASHHQLHQQLELQQLYQRQQQQQTHSSHPAAGPQSPSATNIALERW